MTNKELEKQLWASRIVAMCKHRWSMHEDAMLLEAQVAIEDKTIVAKKEFLASAQTAEQVLKQAYDTALAEKGRARATAEAQEFFSISMTVLGARASLISSLVRREELTHQAQRTHAGALAYVDTLEDFYIIKLPSDYDGYDVIDCASALHQAQVMVEETEERLHAIDEAKYSELTYESDFVVRLWTAMELTMRKARRDEAIAMVNLYDTVMKALNSRTNFDDRQAVYESMEDYALAINHTRWAQNRYEVEMKGRGHNV